MPSKIGRLAKRYAQALYSAMAKDGIAENPAKGLEVAQALKEFASLWWSHQELSQFVLSPMFPAEERKAALLAVAAECGISELGRNFLGLLFDRDRLAALAEITQAFGAVVEKNLGLVQVTVKSASELSEQDKVELAEGLKQKIPGTPVYEWLVEPELLGGIVVLYEGKVIDGSVRGSLERIAQELSV